MAVVIAAVAGFPQMQLASHLEPLELSAKARRKVSTKIAVKTPVGDSDTLRFEGSSPSDVAESKLDAADLAADSAKLKSDQLKALKKVAEDAKEKAEAARTLAEDAKEEGESAKEEAADATDESEKTKEGDLRQWKCADKVPTKAWDSEGNCPQANDGKCCEKSSSKSQLVGFLLQFFAGGFGAGYFYYGHVYLGAGIFSTCLVFCVSMTAMNLYKAGVEIAGNTPELQPFMVVPLCTCCVFYIWVITSWSMMISRDLLPSNGCPLECDL